MKSLIKKIKDIISIKNVSIIFLLFLVVFSISYTATQAVFNKQINYQGKLTNASNVAVANGDYNMEFKLMTVASGGDTTQGSCTTSCAWMETRIGADKVTVTSGLFSVMLGSVTSLSGVDFNQTLYLTVRIGGTGSPSWDGEMTPRKTLGAVPAAVESERVGGFTPAQSASGSQIPVLTSDAIILSGSAAGLTGTSANVLTLQGGSTGDIRFFGATNKISNTGVLTLAGGVTVTPFTAANGVVYATSAGVLTQTAASSGASCLISASAGAAPTWGACTAGGYWSRSGTTVSPTTITDEVNIGNAADIGAYTLQNTGNMYNSGSIVQVHPTFTGTHTINFIANNQIQFINSGIGAYMTVGASNSVNFEGQSVRSLARGFIAGSTVAGTSPFSITTVPAQSSGTTDNNTISITQAINNTGTYAGVYRGFYYNPTLTSLTGTTHRAIETVTGNVIFGSTSGSVGIGTNSPNGLLSLGGNRSATAWGTAGINFQTTAATYTDSSSSGTVATNVANSFGVPTFAASSATTYTNASTLYIAGAPSAGSNATLTNAWALNVNGATRIQTTTTKGLTLTSTGGTDWRFGNVATNSFGLFAPTSASGSVALLNFTDYTDATVPALNFSGGLAAVGYRHFWGINTSAVNYSTDFVVKSFGATHVTGVSDSSNVMTQWVNSDGGAYFAGNVGIGVTNPSYALEVKPTAASIYATSVDNLSVTGWGLRVATASTSSSQNALTVYGGATNIFNVRADGNVGIGVTTPSSFKLEVAGNVGPEADNTRDLGSAVKRWANVYATNFVGTITPGGFTSGSVVFAGSGGTLTQDNANFFWNDTTNRLGIGTTTPNNSIQVVDLIDFNNTDFGTKLGYQAGKNIVSGAAHNTFVGYQAGLSSVASSTNAADENTAIGSWSFLSNETGAHNTANGYGALYANTTGDSNTAVGALALNANTTGELNTSTGYDSLHANVTGNRNVANGYRALYSNTTGVNNVAIGSFALYDLDITNNTDGNNTVVGYNTGQGIITGYNNTIIGANVTGLSSSLTGNIIIADGAGNQRINVDSSGNVSMPIFTATNGVIYATSAGVLTQTAAAGAAGCLIATAANAAPTWGSCGGAGGIRLDQITAANTPDTDNDNLNNNISWAWSTATTQTPLTLTANGSTTGSILSLTSSSAAATTGQKGLNVALTGALTGAQTTYGGYFSNTRTGASAVNVGAYFTAASASGANYAAIFDQGNVGIGTTAPTYQLEIGNGSGSAPGQIRLNGNTDNEHIMFANSGGNRFSIGQNGTVLKFVSQGTGVGGVGQSFLFTGGTPDTGHQGSLFKITGIFNQAAQVTDGLLLNITNTASAAGSSLVNFQIGGSSKFFIDANNGNVGIGTTTPLAKLDVAGTVTTASVSQIIASDITTTTKQLWMGLDGTNNVGYIQAIRTGSGYYPISLNPNGGNIGIGTTSPGSKLEIASGDINFGPYTYNATIKVKDGGGASSTGGSLTVAGGSATTGSSASGGDLILKGGNAYTGGTEPAGNVKIYGGINNFNTTNSTAGSVIFYTGLIPSESMRILGSSGNVGIGTATPFNGATTPIASLELGTFNGTNADGNLIVRGYAALGGISKSGYGAVGSNYYLSSANALLRKSTDSVSLIDFSSGGFIFKNAGSGAANSSVSLSSLWTLNSSGHWLAGTDNTYDIGASGATRARTIYAGTSVVIGSTGTTSKASFLRSSDSSEMGYISAGSSSFNIIHSAGTTIGSSTNGVFFTTNGTWMGKSAISNVTPTALVHIAAGTATASTAPLKFTSGVNLTAPEAGAMEWDGTNLFITQTTGPTRKTIAYTTDLTSGYVPYTGATSNVNLGAFTLTSPTIIGGTGTTSDLNLQTTSGVGAAGADMHFLVGNNGATEAMTILNSGNVGVGTASPGQKLEINGNLFVNNASSYGIFTQGKGINLGGSTNEWDNIKSVGSGSLTLTPYWGVKIDGVYPGGSDSAGIPLLDINSNSIQDSAPSLRIRNNNADRFLIDVTGKITAAASLTSAAGTGYGNLFTTTHVMNTSAQYVGTGFISNVTTASGAGGNIVGQSSNVTLSSGTNLPSSIIGYGMDVNYTATSGTLGAITAMQLQGYVGNGATVTNVYGTKFVGLFTPSSGVVTNQYGYYYDQTYITPGTGYAFYSVVNPSGGTLASATDISINPGSGKGVKIGTGTPTAWLNIKAGTATAGQAPLKFTSGTNLTTAEAGAMEWDGTNLFITQTTGPTRKTLAYTTDIPAAGANTALSNLASVAINTSLLPGADDTIDLGSDSLRWRDAYLGGETLHLGTSTSDEATFSYTTSSNVLSIGSTGTITLTKPTTISDNTNALNITSVLAKTNAYQDVRQQWQTTADTGTSFSGVARGMVLYASGHGSSGYAGWADYEGRPLLFYTGCDDLACNAVAERMRIGPTGLVNIGGNTSPTNMFSVGSTSQFQVNSSGAIAAATGIISSGTIQFSALTTNGALYTSGGNGTLTTTAPTSGALGYWSRSGTTLSTTTAGDSVSLGLGLILGGTPTGGDDVNVIYSNSSNTTLGFVAGASRVAHSSTGPAFVARGNTYSAIANQRGSMYFLAGDPSSPTSGEGIIAFYTGATIQRLLIEKTGEITQTYAGTTSTGYTLNANSLTSGKGLAIASSSLTSGSLVDLTVTGTAAASNTQKGLNISTSGANATSTQTTYGGYFSNTHTGTSSTNVGLYVSSSGGTNNYAAIFDQGRVGIGTTAPTGTFTIGAAQPATNASGNGTAAIALFNTASTTGKGGDSSYSTGTVSAGIGAAFTLVGGTGGAITGTPTTGFGGSGGAFSLTSGTGGAGAGTNAYGGAGGNFTIAAGGGGFGSTSGGIGGYVEIKGGNAGSLGNIDGGNIYIVGGSKNSSGIDGNVILGSTNSGTLRGNVGIGQTVPALALHVGSSSVTNSTNLIRLEDANSTCDFNADTGSPACGSDRTLKKDITSLDTVDILTRVTMLNPVSYRWLTDQSGANVQNGFIAQEVAEQFPDLVTDHEWIDGTTRKFLNTGGLMPYVVGAVKEMNIQITGINDLARPNTMRENLAVWFGNIENGIEKIYAKVMQSDRVETKTLCVGSTCVTEEQFLQMVQGSSNANSGGGGNGGGSGDGNPTPTPPTDVCLNIEGDQATVPDGMHVDGENNCVANDATPPPADEGEGDASGEGDSGGEAPPPETPPTE